MKKSLLILLIAIILSGCTITRIDNYDYDKLINNILSINIKMLNKIGNGYEYYTPKGVVRIEANDYNDILKRDDIKYYLYVDVVSYYYKNEEKYKKNDNVYYSLPINKDEKQGYIEIREDKNKLYVEMNYNYAKIETYVDKKDLKKALTDMSYMLSSVKFNDSLLKKMYDSGDLASKEEVYKLFDNKEKEGDFLEYIKEFDKYDGDSNESQAVEDEIKVEKSTTTTKEKTTTTTKEEVSVTTTSSE